MNNNENQNSNSSKANLALLIPFIDQSKSFMLGWECGVIFEAIKTRILIKERMIHTENIKQIEIMCESQNYRSIIVILDKDWSVMHACPTEMIKDESPLKA